MQVAEATSAINRPLRSAWLNCLRICDINANLAKIVGAAVDRILTYDIHEVIGGVAI